MGARLTTWWTILRIGLTERLVYRGDFALGTLMRFLPVVTQVFLWYAIFQSRLDQSVAQLNATMPHASSDVIKVGKSTEMTSLAQQGRIAFGATTTITA